MTVGECVDSCRGVNLHSSISHLSSLTVVRGWQCGSELRGTGTCIMLMCTWQLSPAHKCRVGVFFSDVMVSPLTSRIWCKRQFIWSHTCSVKAHVRTTTTRHFSQLFLFWCDLHRKTSATTSQPQPQPQYNHMTQPHFHNICWHPELWPKTHSPPWRPSAGISCPTPPSWHGLSERGYAVFVILASFGVNIACSHARGNRVGHPSWGPEVREEVALSPSSATTHVKVSFKVTKQVCLFTRGGETEHCATRQIRGVMSDALAETPCSLVRV